MATLKIISASDVSSLEFEAVEDKTREQSLAIVTDVKEHGEVGLMRQGQRLGDIPKEVDPTNPGDYQYVSSYYFHRFGPYSLYMVS